MLLIHKPRFPSLKPAPKDIAANKAYRRKIIEAANVSPEFRTECWIRAKSDYKWYVDTFGWTFNSKQYPTSPRRLFILREYQEHLSQVLIQSVGKNDVIIPKARDMGASWVCLSVLAWFWQFIPYFTALLGSWKQDYVDKIGDPNSLFWKLDYFLDMQPGWMVPRIRPQVERKQNSLTNPENFSAITGEATNPNFGRAGRPAVIMLDEFAAVDCAYDVLSATRDTSNTRWIISTYAGAYGAFYDRVKKMQETTPHLVVGLHWTLHPGKRRGLYQFLNGKIEFLDPGYKYPDNYEFVRDGKQRSPWYDLQCTRAGSPQEIAQEIDMEPQSSGYQFLDTISCEQIANRQARACVHRGRLVFRDPMKDDITWVDDPDGEIELWITLNSMSKYSGVHDCVVACDVAQGSLNEEGSDSVAVVYDSLTKEKLAQFTSNQTPPEKFGRIAIALCRFFSGPRGPALLNAETNGPGNAFAQEVIKEQKYLNVWMRGDMRKPGRERTSIPFWHSSTETKFTLLKAYRFALMEDRIVNRSKPAIMQCSEFINHHGIKIEHAKSLKSNNPSTQGENHGDMVIADALAYLTLNDIPAPKTATTTVIPETSFAGLEARRLAKEQQSRGSWNWKGR